MSIFTNDVRYAVNAIHEVSLYQDIKAAHCDDVALNIGAPLPFLQRAMSKLGKAGIVEVKRGPGGGYRVTAEALRTKTILDVMQALGHSVEENLATTPAAKLDNIAFDALNVTLEEFLS